MIRFPITDLLGQQECDDYLLNPLHPNGFRCPDGHPLPAEQAPHDRHRAPVEDYRCRTCGRVFNHCFSSAAVSRRDRYRLTA